MRDNLRFIVLMSLAVLVASAIRAHGADGCCAHCGCACSCQKVCRLVCEEKKVDVICWGCKCEDFCVPGHSKPGCQHCEEVCGDCDKPCDCTAPYAKPKNFVWNEWIPGCAKILTKKKLMQKIVTKKVPSYKWVVEDLCPQCESSCGRVAVAPGGDVPPPPVTDAKLLYGETRVAMIGGPK
jgi:hypothetical protein